MFDIVYIFQPISKKYDGPGDDTYRQRSNLNDGDSVWKLKW